MQKYHNESNIGLAMAAYLAADFYDYESDTVSATSLIRPLKQIVLAKQVPAGDRVVDIKHLLKSRIGTSIHDGVEKVWTTSKYKQALKNLGHSESLINRIAVNPETVEEGMIPVYVEKRSYRTIGGFKISGKFDLVMNGCIEDIKSTSTYVYTNQSKVEDYKLQGSIYRWLNPEIVTKDYMIVHYVFTDYMPAKAAIEHYPNSPVIQQKIPLLTLEETEQYISSKLSQIAKYSSVDQASIPPCNDKDLWRRPSQWKYYKNPEKMGRATKNFETRNEALIFQMENNGAGVIVEKPGEVIACNYCPAFSICHQKDQYIADGSLKT